MPQMAQWALWQVTASGKTVYMVAVGSWAVCAEVARQCKAVMASPMAAFLKVNSLRLRETR